MTMRRGAEFYDTEAGHSVTLKGGKDKWTVVTYGGCYNTWECDADQLGHREVTIKHDKTSVELTVCSSQLGPSRKKKESK